MKLDLTYNGKLNKEASIILDSIANDKRVSFTKLIDEISINFETNLDWHLTGPASRNTLASPFFYYYCSFYLIDYFIRNKKNISLIIIDSFAFEDILKKYFLLKGEKIRIKNRNNNLFSRLFLLIKPYIVMSIELLRQLVQFICARKTNGKNSGELKTKITIIDTFVLPGYITNDRYYNGLWEKLSSEKKDTTFFVPTIVLVPFSKMLGTFNKLRLSEKNYLIKEDYLTINDLLYAIFHYFRAIKIKPPPIKLLGVDISELIIEEIKSMRSYSSSVIGLLNYRFAKQLKLKSVDLGLIINWFENQVNDKGWNAGFNKFFTTTHSIGYSGQIPSLNYLCSFPSKSDVKLALIPSEICVTGKKLIQRTKQYSNQLNVRTAPAFRFKHLWEHTLSLTENNYYTILITLSQFEKQTNDLVKMVYKYSKYSKINNIRFWIKPHPSIPVKLLRKWWRNEWPKQFRIVEDDISHLLPRSNILISGMSSVCLEAVALGVPLIVVENISGLRFNSLPEGLPKQMWQNCQSDLDINNSINYFRSRKIDQNSKMAENIKENYFEKVTIKSVSQFIGEN